MDCQDKWRPNVNLLERALLLARCVWCQIMEENVILTWFIVFFECADASQIRPTVTNVKPSPVPQTFVWLNFILTMRIEWYKGILSTLNLKINFPHEISYRRPSLYFSRLSFQPEPFFFFFLNQVDFSLHVRLKNKSDLISHFTANWNFNSFNSLTFNVIQMFLLLFSISFWLLCCSSRMLKQALGNTLYFLRVLCFQWPVLN